MLPTHWHVARAAMVAAFFSSCAIAGWHTGGIMSKPDKASLILTAQRAGYRVTQDDDGSWWITTPRAPRRPEQTLGAYATSERAWMGAANLALQDD